MRAAWFVTTEPPPALWGKTQLRQEESEDHRERQLGGVAGAGFGFAVPLRPRRAGFGAAGGIGPASGPGSAGVTGAAAGSAGVTGAATGSATGAVFAGSAGVVAGRGMRRCFATREPAGVNEQTCAAPSTLVSVSRSRDFFARSETMVGATPGCPLVAGVNSPNCIATPV